MKILIAVVLSSLLFYFVLTAVLAHYGIRIPPSSLGLVTVGVAMACRANREARERRQRPS